ncbi:MAG: hypothetical protein ABH818_01450, partial [Patescibacteria group bacterium]
DGYTVTYNETTDLFSVRANGGNTLNPTIAWLTYTGSDSAAATLGYTANDTAIRDTTATSDTAVAFNVRTGDNDGFGIVVNGNPTSGSTSVTVTSGVYTGSALASQLQTNINSATPVYDVTVSYSNNKFKISSTVTGTNSTIKVIEGTYNFLSSVKMNNDDPIQGVQAPGLAISNHTIQFTTSVEIPAGGNIHLTFDSGFGLSSANYQDMDLTDDGTDLSLATTASGSTWGASVSSQEITFTSATGVIAANSVVIIEIGTNATYDATGVGQISNPSSSGVKEILIEARNSSNTVLGDVNIGVYIMPTNSIALRAAVDSTLSFGIQIGVVLDFGSLTPNAYHKLGGPQPAYGYINLTSITVSNAINEQTVRVRGIDYEMSDDGTINAGSEAKVSIVDGSNNYITAAQVAEDLYKAINNYDGDFMQAKTSVLSNTIVYVVASRVGTTGNSYDLSTTVTGATVSGSDFIDGFGGYNNISSSVGYNSGTDVGNSQTGTNIFISTNTDNGYVITVENTDTNGANNNSDGLSNGTSEITEWTTSSTYGYGILASARSTVYGDGTAYIIEPLFRSTGNVPKGLNTTPVTIASYSSQTAGDNIAIEYNVRIDANQEQGAYEDTVIYISTLRF